MGNYGTRKGLVGYNIQTTSYEVSVPATQNAGEITEFTWSYPIDINIIRGSFFNKPEFLGDFAEMVVGEDTVIGAVTVDVAINDEWLSVSSTVLDNIERGFFIKVDGNDLGRCLEVDINGGRIRVAPIANAITAGAYILQTISFVPHIYLEGTNSRDIIEGGLETSFIPADTELKVKYYNNNLTAKTFSIRVEYHY